LEQRLDEVNRMLLSRGQAPLEHRNLTAVAWIEALSRVAEIAAARTLDRRSFFRNAIKYPKERLDAAIKDVSDTFVPPGMLLEPGSGDVLLPFVPLIDPERCNGCDACVRLCPQQAILFDGGESDSAEFSIHAERCSGCGICVDVCEQNAVAIERLSPEVARRIPLQSESCRVCGADFHVPAARANGDALCWVCHRTNHHRNLYQVLD
jgi:NAD-dependent dihydropyrimidine dehydrogenase PreA subunit